MSAGIVLTDELIHAVRDAVDIVDIAGEHLSLQKSGKRYQALCPFHKEKTPSFSVDAERGLYYCFGCGAGGDAIRLYQHLSGEDFRGAIDGLARRYGIEVRTSRPGGGAQPTSLAQRIEKALAAAAELFQQQLRASEDALRYLRQRRIDESVMERYGLGFAPDGWHVLTESLGKRLPMTDLEAAGLVARSQRGGDRPYDRFRNRLMFPIRDPAGRLVGFGGRTLGDDRAKYINTSETERFQKSELLYGLDLARRAIRDSGRAVLVEGYFDVIGAEISGVQGVVASMGTSLTERQVRLLSRYAQEVVVGYDGDRAGEEASRRALPLLLGAGLAVLRARLPAGQDPDSLRLDEGPAAVCEILEGAPDALQLEIDAVSLEVRSQPRQQAAAASRLRSLLDVIPDRVLRFAYGRQAAEQIGLPEQVFWQAATNSEHMTEAPAAASTEAPSRREVRTLEERILELLLGGMNQELELPPSEAFFDPACRQIYEALKPLCERAEDTTGLDLGRRVLIALPPTSVAIDRLAGLLQDSPISPPGELEGALAKLERRWLKRRIDLLASDIHQAQREGDAERLQQLLEQKSKLSRLLHGRNRA